jgi:signal transduction histidine kinase
MLSSGACDHAQTCRMMRGDVTVVSASGNGSMFTLRLPVGVVR